MKNSIDLIAPSLPEGADKNKSHSWVSYPDNKRFICSCNSNIPRLWDYEWTKNRFTEIAY